MKLGVVELKEIVSKMEEFQARSRGPTGASFTKSPPFFKIFGLKHEEGRSI